MVPSRGRPIEGKRAIPTIECPGCGEDEELRGDRGEDGIVLTCESCGATWQRDVTPTCTLCGSEDLEAVPTSTLEDAGRGEQRTPTGIVLRYRCWSCGARDATSDEPEPAPPDWQRRSGQRASRLYRPPADR